MDDKTLIELIAYIWVKCGGDSTSFYWSVGEIRRKIEEFERG